MFSVASLSLGICTRSSLCTSCACAGLGACSAHAQWGMMMGPDTSHVVSVVTVLSNVTFRTFAFFSYLHSLWHAHNTPEHTHTHAHIMHSIHIYHECIFPQLKSQSLHGLKMTHSSLGHNCVFKMLQGSCIVHSSSALKGITDTECLRTE